MTAIQKLAEEVRAAEAGRLAEQKALKLASDRAMRKRQATCRMLNGKLRKDMLQLAEPLMKGGHVAISELKTGDNSHWGYFEFRFVDRSLSERENLPLQMKVRFTEETNSKVVYSARGHNEHAFTYRHAFGPVPSRAEFLQHFAVLIGKKMAQLGLTYGT